MPSGVSHLAQLSTEVLVGLLSGGTVLREGCSAVGLLSPTICLGFSTTLPARRGGNLLPTETGIRRHA